MQHRHHPGVTAGSATSPDRIIVVADNCTGKTEVIAAEMGAEVFVTQGNTDRKAGALNQALRMLLPTCTELDVILVMDADTVLSTTYTGTALDALQRFPLLDAVGGLFYGDPGGGLLGQLQRNEYLRYQGQIIHRRGRVFVLTGTATVFRAEALAEVAAARGVLIPGRPGDVYDSTALTEDNELTIALKSLGSRMVSPPPRPRIPDDTVPLMSQKCSSRRQPTQDLFPEPGPGPRGT
ncbi:MAG: glycosyltransferase family 2 protein [Actinobacteria bacterium]|nr:glycosyltransferase family 2 protein [Actinomycetota bacterium]